MEEARLTCQYSVINNVYYLDTPIGRVTVTYDSWIGFCKYMVDISVWHRTMRITFEIVKACVEKDKQAEAEKLSTLLEGIDIDL